MCGLSKATAGSAQYTQRVASALIRVGMRKVGIRIGLQPAADLAEAAVLPLLPYRSDQMSAA